MKKDFFTHLLYNNIFQKSVLVMLVGFILFSFCIYANMAIINADASYYMGVSRLISEGLVPFSDFALGYSPLSFYLMCIPFNIWGYSYTCAISVLLLIHIANAFFVYRILYVNSFSQMVSMLGGLFYLYYVSLFSGYGYVLEPFVLLFGLIAIYLVQSHSLYSLFLSGFFCSCSLFCKQYGLGFLALVFLYVLLDNQFPNKKERLTVSILGFFIGLLLGVILLMLQGIHISLLLSSLQGSDYQREGVLGMIVALCHVFIRISPLFISLWIPLLYWNDFKADKFWVISLIGVVGFLLPLYVRPYLHYVILSLPFMIFFIFRSIRAIKTFRLKLFVFLFLIVSSIITVISMAQFDVNLILGNNRSYQRLISEKIATFIPKEEKDVYISFHALYTTVLNSYTPPLLTEYGMSNGFVTMPRDVLKLLQNSQYAIISMEEYDGNNQNCSPKVKSYLQSNFRLVSTIENDDIKDILLYKRTKEVHN